MKPRVYVTLDLLNKCLKDNNAVLIKINYADSRNKLTRDAEIEYICNCKKNGKRCFRNLINLGAFCEECAKQNEVKKIIKTNLEKYGVEHPQQNEAIRAKSVATNIEKYGSEHPLHNPKIRSKQKATNLERYGVEYYIESKEGKNKIKKTNLERYGFECSFQSEEVKNKSKVTNIERYGVEYATQNKEVYNKVKATNLERYGVECSAQNKDIQEKIKHTISDRYGTEHYFQSNDYKKKSKETSLGKYGTEFATQNELVKNKTKKTCFEKYGVEHTLQVKEIRDKGKQTMMEKYGVEHPNQNLEILEKATRNAHKYKEYKMPSGIIKKVQGYESFALDELVKIHTEEQLKTDRKDVPRIEYTIGDKKHYYFPDIWIPHENKLIEVKSTWTMKKKSEITMAKANSCKDKGYCFEIWVYDGKGGKNIILPDVILQL